jgi:hypothetical protein
VSAFGSPYTPYPPVQNGKEKRGGLLLPADYARLITTAERATLALQDSPPRARVFRSTNQAIASGVATAISFDTTRVNSAGTSGGAAPWVAGSPTRLTCPAGGAGFYLVGGNVSWANTGGGTTRQMLIRYNGATFLEADTGPSPGGVWTPSESVTTGAQIVAGDYVELVLSHDAGVAVNAVAGAAFSMEFWFVRICA